MNLPEWSRVILYVVVGVTPIWQDFFTKSTDYSLRGLAMPVIATIGAAATIVLARTKGRNETPSQ